MKKILLLGLIGVLIFFIALAWYLHASIYWDLGKAGIGEPSDIHEYTLGKGKGEPLVYAAIGDSLTAGVGVSRYSESYPYLIAEKLASTTRSAVVLAPFAVPGVRSSYVLDYFIEPVIARKPDIVTLFIGVNDIHGNIPIAIFNQNYTKILTRLTTETTARIFVINLPDIGTPKLISFPYRYYFDLKAEEYNTIIKKLAAEFNVTYIDLYSAHAPYALEQRYYAADSFHPNALGYTLWADAIYANFSQ